MKTKLIISTLLVTLTFLVNAKEKDPGKAVIGNLKATFVYATNTAEDPAKATLLSDKLLAEVNQKKLNFAHYYTVGSDMQKIYKCYPNWLKPFKGSDKIMICYEVKKPCQEGAEVEIEFWREKQKVFSTTAINITCKKPLIITGPKWRDGKIIMIFELIHDAHKY